MGSCYLTGLHGFDKDNKKARKYLIKARDLSQKKGDDCVLTEPDVANINRYLVLCGDASASKLGAHTGSSQSDGRSANSSVPCKTVVRTENDTISTLTPHSAANNATST